MPSLRKRAPRVDPVRAAAISAAIDDAAGGGDPSVLMAGRPENVAAVVADVLSPVQPQSAEATQDAQDQQPQATPRQDDDSAALRAQLDALRAAEQQAQRAMESQAQIKTAMSRNTAPAASPEAQTQTARVQFTESEDRLNSLYPQLLSEPLHAQAASAAVAQLAQAGMQRGSAEYESNLRPTFESILARAKAASVPPRAPAPEMEPEAPRAPMSAPVSRSIPTSDGMPATGKVTLSAQEREHAALAGISEIEYARNKLKLDQLKKSGFYNDRDG